MNREDLLRYDPRLVEEAVFFSLREHAEAKAFYRERNRLYEITDPEQREKAFQNFNRAWFLRLGLAEPIDKAVNEQPLLISSVRYCLVARALRKKEEGAELLVNSEEDLSEKERRTVCVLIRPESLLDPLALLSFLRHEFLHIRDMLDPGFGYEPVLPTAEGGPTHDRLLQERYRVLWDTTIDGRMVRSGWAPECLRTERFRDFCRAFPMFGEESRKVFSHFFDRDPHAHPELIALASDPSRRIEDLRATPHPGSRCPLCGFPTHAFEPQPELLPPSLVAQVAQDYPQWQPSHGLCTQCADLYRARPISASAAMSLPGLRPYRASG